MNDYTVNINIKALSNFGKITKNLASQLNAMQSKISNMNAKLAASSKGAQAFNTALNRLAFVAIPAVTLASRNFLKEGIGFQEALVDLGALTGITGKQLEGLGDKALEMAEKFGLSAADVLGGMKRIASNKSELIGIPGAIESIANKAAILAKASGLSLFESGQLITTTMNQFDLAVSDADRIINTMAKAAELGSFELGTMAQSFGRSAAAMKLAGMTFEEASATVQGAARLGLSGEMIGTQLKTAITRLTAVNDAFNPKLVGWQNALENIKEANLDPGQLASLFGMESLAVGDKIITASDLIEQWTEKVQGTTKAYDMADKKMSTQLERYNRALARLSRIKIEFFMDKRTQDAISFFLDKLEIFLKQSTPWARLLWMFIKDMAVLLSSALIITGISKIAGAFKLLIFPIKWLMATKPILAITNMVRLLSVALKGVTGVALGPWLLFIGATLGGMIGIVKSLTENWGLLIEEFNNNGWVEGIKMSFKLVVWGIIESIVWLVRKVEDITAPISNRIAKITGETYEAHALSDSILDFWKDTLFTKDQQALMGNTGEEIQAAKYKLTKETLGTPVAASMLSGDLKIELNVNEDGNLVPKVIDKPANTEVKVGHTHSLPTFMGMTAAYPMSH